MNSRETTLQLAEAAVDIVLEERAVSALPLCRRWFEGFFTDPGDRRARVRVGLLEADAVSPALRRLLQAPVMEAWLSTEDLVKALPRNAIDPLPVSRIRAARCLDGLLLFDDATCEGRIWLTHSGAGCLRPLHRLLWMYFAMALGETARFFVHCAAVESNGRAHLFWGNSGAGKSTVAALLKGGRILSDDAPIVARKEEKLAVYPSPYRQWTAAEDAAVCKPAAAAAIGGFYLLHQDRRLFLENLPRRQVFAEILQRHVHFFEYLSANARLKAFEMLYAAAAGVPAYRLHFPLNADLWPLLNNHGTDSANVENPEMETIGETYSAQDPESRLHSG